MVEGVGKMSGWLYCSHYARWKEQQEEKEQAMKAKAKAEKEAEAKAVVLSSLTFPRAPDRIRSHPLNVSLRLVSASP